jgi:cyclophilin family peptidyl-prolyl cis-trans isomerase
MVKSLLLVFFVGIILAGCARDVNLAKDVDMLLPSTKPGLDEVMNQQRPAVAGTSTNQQEQVPQTPPPTVTPTPITEPATVMSKTEDAMATLTTSKGVIKLKLYRSKAPNTVKNFLDKAKSGYYAGLTFHRVESWVVQGGDPKGNGTGGGAMPTELNQEAFKVGSLGVARGGDIKFSNDSQFFICTEDCSWLTGQYTNFGEVVEGMEIAKQIAIGDKITSIVE